MFCQWTIPQTSRFSAVAGLCSATMRKTHRLRLFFRTCSKLILSMAWLTPLIPFEGEELTQPPLRGEDISGEQIFNVRSTAEISGETIKFVVEEILMKATAPMTNHGIDLERGCQPELAKFPSADGCLSIYLLRNERIPEQHPLFVIVSTHRSPVLLGSPTPRPHLLPALDRATGGPSALCRGRHEQWMRLRLRGQLQIALTEANRAGRRFICDNSHARSLGNTPQIWRWHERHQSKRDTYGAETTQPEMGRRW